MIKYLLLFLLLGCKPEENCTYEDQVLRLSYVISAECIECDSMEQVLVGSVIMFRLFHPQYPKNIDSVIQQRNQFHGFNAHQYKYNERCYQIACKLMEMNMEFLPDGIFPESRKRTIEPILFFYNKNMAKPRFVKKIIYKMKHHNFGI